MRAPRRTAPGCILIAIDHRIQSRPSPRSSIILLGEEYLKQSSRWMVDQRIRGGVVGAVRFSHRRPHDRVNASEELHRISGVFQFGEQRIQRVFGSYIEPRYRISHFRNAFPQQRRVLGVLPLMQRQCALHLPFGSARQVGQNDVHEPELSPVAAEKAPDALRNMESDDCSLVVCGEPGELGNGT